MLQFLLRRIGHSIFVLLAIAFMSFLIFQFVGDPISNMVGQDTSMAERERLRTELGLDRPVIVQFGDFVMRIASGDLGVSYRDGQKVSEMIAQRMPATLELAAVAAVFALAMGIPMGIYCGIRQDSFSSRVFQTVSLLGVSLPPFVIGILLIFIFGVTLRILPTFGRGDVVDLGFWQTGLLTSSGLKSLIMPAMTLGLFQMTLIMRLVRAGMAEVLGTEFIKFGRARGLSDWSIYFRHGLKNTLVPVITVVGLQLGSLIAFSIIVETVFQWPGLGLLFIRSVQFSDVPVMSAYLLFVGVVFVTINFIVDMLYLAVDPRLRTN
ncbi:ABC transporter permease [Aureimonas fodinaquatilis]|uniref:ABC transporter permease n=1 Tax=Aureimonas fodinaquatilis TaxID=2565783 RepID=A0A5B0DT05_9HYPH|nr:ABC transporter permease [Aureimonas fodinaquatilis]KAA0969533.1 ABC transporter permease [Aureimonas fodinaquatilis]